MKKVNITESEWEVMKVLWGKDKLTLKEITNEIVSDEWSYTTIRTLVTRLFKKGMISADKTGSSFKYFATVKEDECKREKICSFMSKVFDGSVSMLVSSLIKKSDLTNEEYEELMRLVYKVDRGDNRWNG